MSIDLGQYFTSDFFKKIARTIYKDLVYPAAEAYVKSTDNTWDDSALAFLNGFVDSWLGPES